MSNHAPQHAYQDEREHAHSQRLVKLSVEIAGGRVHALLGPSRAVDERDQDEDRRDPMDDLSDGAIARESALHHFVAFATSLDDRSGKPLCGISK